MSDPAEYRATFELVDADRDRDGRISLEEFAELMATADT